jgi:hypothetical protein
VLQIGGKPKEEKDKDKIYARLSSRDAVVILPQEIEKLLETQPNDLRDRNLVRVEADIVDRVTLEGADAARSCSRGAAKGGSGRRRQISRWRRARLPG